MSKKKSYMDNNSILSEGFFDKLKSFLRLRPKIDKEEFFKKGMSKEMDKLNKATDEFDKVLKKRFGKKYPDLPKFTWKDFINS
tara:strand:- start:187 stop:435 length:249 start_codon:yes stop_codon:yes gene_type:complete